MVVWQYVQRKGEQGGERHSDDGNQGDVTRRNEEHSQCQHRNPYEEEQRATHTGQAEHLVGMGHRVNATPNQNNIMTILHTQKQSSLQLV